MEKEQTYPLTLSQIKKSGWVDLRGGELGVCVVDMKFRFLYCHEYGWRSGLNRPGKGKDHVQGNGSTMGSWMNWIKLWQLTGPFKQNFYHFGESTNTTYCVWLLEWKNLDYAMLP